MYIDANPNPNTSSIVKLKKYVEKDKNSSSKKIITINEAKAVSTQGNLSVFLANYNITGIEHLSVTIDDQEFNYNKDLQDLLNLENENNESKEMPNRDSIAPTSTESKEELRTKYLKEVWDNWHRINALNKNDIARLEKFKDNLSKTQAIPENVDDLSEEGRKLLSQILSWSPDYIGLTPIAPAINNTDAIEVKVSIKYKNIVKEDVVVGRYRTIGGLSADFSGNVFLTGLKNSPVYTEMVDIDGTEELRAKINKRNQRSVGYGINTGVSFRTGSLLRPTLNVAAFLPLDEEITPFLGFGPGLSLQGEKVKLSFSGGLAFGSINTINEQYLNKDLSDFESLTNEMIAEKAWESSWYVSIGISIKLKEEDK